MRAFLAFFVLLLLPVPGCDPQGDDGPNSKDFGPQPWPGPCWSEEYQDGELIREIEFTWEDSLLARWTLHKNGEINNCSKYYYNESGRLIHVTYQSGCTGPVGHETTYEWNENGQMSSYDYTNYTSDGTTILSRSRGIYTYGPDDELVEVRRSGQDLETDEWAETSFTRYFYDDLGRLVRQEDWDIEGGLEEYQRTDEFLYEGEDDGYYQRQADTNGDGVFNWIVLMSYDDQGRWFEMATENGSWLWRRYMDDLGNLMKDYRLDDQDESEYLYSYDCWE